MVDENFINEVAELIVTLRSWGMHIGGPLTTVDADTGISVGGWAGGRVEELLLKLLENK